MRFATQMETALPRDTIFKGFDAHIYLFGYPTYGQRQRYSYAIEGLLYDDNHPHRRQGE